MRRAFLVAIGVAACGDTTNTTLSQLNLDKPIDVAFACHGGLRLTGGGAADPSQPVATTAQPVQSCEIRSGARLPTGDSPVPPGQEDLTGAGGLSLPATSWYALILQSVPGTVAIARWDTKPSSTFTGNDVTVLDADPLTPGKNSISIGEHPVGITTDRVGCFAVTANAGSCDLSTLDIGSAITPPLNVSRLVVTNAAGQPIRAKPAAIVAEPAGGTIGVGCPMTATGLAYIAYPNCHLVAGVDLATGTIVTGVQYDATGVPTLLANGNVSCPDECGSAPTTPGVRPVALDVKEDPRSHRRALAIGADNAASIAVVELGADARPLSMFQLALANPTGKLGITQLRISPQMGMGGSSGFLDDDIAPGGQMQFIYAVASDRTVRVAEILNVRKECDTQVDPRLIHDVRSIKQMSCFGVGDVTTPARRPGARGPGIELVGDAVPTSVDILKVDNFDGDMRPNNPAKLVGYFGFISAMNGSTYVVNVTDDNYPDLPDPTNPIAVPVPLAIAHQLRDQIPDRGAIATTPGDMPKPICDTNGPDPDSAIGNDGGPRAALPPASTLPSADVAPTKIAELPSLRQVLCTGSDDTKPVPDTGFAAPVDVRDFVFPDLVGLRADETWSLTWEGSLSRDRLDTSINGPSVRDAQIFVDGGGMRVVDHTRPFCDAGVEPFDIVQLRGCDPANGDSECPVGYTCFVHPQSQVQGLGACMLASEADRLANACKSFLTSLRRYTVGRSTSGELQLLPRAVVLRTTPLDGCTSDAQCQALANYAAQNASTTNPVDDHTPPDPHTYSCVVDAGRKPGVGGDGQPLKRCVETCMVDTDCVVGAVCQNHTCMEGVVPPQACVNAPQKFELRASEAFTALGLRTGYVHPIIADTGGNCVKNPAAHPWTLGRIPLVAPPCDPMQDPRTGRKPNGQLDVNPCSLVVDQTELAPQYVAGTCTPATPATQLVTRKAQAIRFRNRGMTLTFVDPTYPGDARCIGDRAGTLGNVPLVLPGYQIAFRLTAGLSPLLVGIAPSYPIKVVKGPTNSLWVVDEGDFLSQSISSPSTRGKVFRVEPQSLGIVNILQ